MFNWFKKNKEDKSYTVNNNFGALQFNNVKGRGQIDVNAYLLAQAYRKHVYACINIVSNAVASTELKLISMRSNSSQKSFFPTKSISKNFLKHDKSLNSNMTYKIADYIDEVQVHPFLTLLETPAKNETTYTLMSKIVINLELFGSAYVLITKNGETPVGLDVLHSQMITPDIDPSTNMARGYWYVYNAKSIYYTPDQLMVIRYYNPRSDIDGQSPLEAVYNQYLMDNSFDEMQLAINDNSGNPSSVIKYTAKSLTEKERDILQSQWAKVFKGNVNAGKPFIIGNDFEIVKMGLTPTEMDYVNGRKVAMKAICEAFGVPVCFLDTEGLANRAVYDTAKYMFEQNTVLPKLRNIVDQINNQVLSLYGEEKIFLSYDDPVKQNKIDKIDGLIKLVQSGILTIEEAKAELEE